MPTDQPFDLRAKFRAVSRRLRASYDAEGVGGSTRPRRAMRPRASWGQFLARHLPPAYGVSRAKSSLPTAASAARSTSVNLRRVPHRPCSRTRTCRPFPRQCVYAAIEPSTISRRMNSRRGCGTSRRWKRWPLGDRRAAHAIASYHGPKQNPPIFGAIFALESTDVQGRLSPSSPSSTARCPSRPGCDAVCGPLTRRCLPFLVLREPAGRELWMPAVLDPDTRLGHYDSKEDTLFLFLSLPPLPAHAKDLFPPDLMSYVSRRPRPEPVIYRPAQPAQGTGKAPSLVRVSPSAHPDGDQAVEAVDRLRRRQAMPRRRRMRNSGSLNVQL